MNQQVEEHHYSLKTLRALYEGATRGCTAAHGKVRLLMTDEIGCACGTLVSVGHKGLFVRLDNGTTRHGVQPARILHAEVV